MKKEQEHWLREQIKTISNLCAVSQILLDAKRNDLLPTILELIYLEAQQVVDDNCVVK